MRYLLFLILIAGLVGCSQPMNEEKSFEDITEKILENPSQLRYGVAVTYRDGQPQAFVTGFGAPNQLLAWRNGQLRDITPQELRNPESDAIGAAWCDIDNDGNEELYVLTTDRYGGQKQFRDQLYSYENGAWKNILEEQPVTNSFAGRSVACTHSPEGPGFFVARYGGPMQLITYTERGLEDVAPKYGLNKVTGGRSIVSIPTKKGVDLFVGNERGPNYYYEQRNGTYTEKAQNYGVSEPLRNARGVDILDIDQDNKFDIALGNWEARHSLYKRQEDSFEDVSTSYFNSPTPIRSVVAADFNNDGQETIFMNNIGAPNKYTTETGERLPIGEAEEPQGLGTGIGVADFDNDGVLEVLVSHGESGRQKMSLYKIPTSKQSIRIMPVLPSGAPARNARVEIEGKGVFSVDGGSAYLNQMEPIVHIGQNEPLNITVMYPGMKQVTKEVSTGTTTINLERE